MKNWKKVGPVTLKDCYLSRTVCVYDDIHDFCRRQQGLIEGNHIGDDTVLASVSGGGFPTIIEKYRFLLLDEQDLIIPRWRIAECYSQVQGEPEFWNYIYRYYRKYHKGLRFRYDPIPDTGHRRWGFGQQFRSPKTMAERREADGLGWDEDAKFYGVKCRNKRSHKTLPNAYDDIQRGDLKNRRNWKQNRKKQWT